MSGITAGTAAEAVRAEAVTTASENASIVDLVVQKAGVSYPLSSTQAMSCAMAAEYEINRQRLDYILGVGAFRPPEKLLGRLAWSRANIVDLLQFLEHKRSWMPFSNRHTPKLTRDEQRRQNQVMAEVEQIEDELRVKTSCDLLNIMAWQNDLSIRILCRQILDERAKIATEANENGND